MQIDTISGRTWFDRFISNLPRLSHLTFSRKAWVVVCFFLVGIVGYIDYLTGYERSLLLFYLLPISVAAWFGSLILGLAMVVISIAAWVLSDLSAGIPSLGFWSLSTAFVSYSLFAGV